ncbi:MAG TPA: hypothetical protein PL017_10465 [Tenuifilaceae bacterium]|nr:hypothetical protein [Tenuifilaceae bacterium]HPE18276.1 hypothetical protein [Tenuifilaceae bacterium]HPJ46510.1 hypothetical protein [Tenuifilaceae bacterium]HPQ33392.1 hypothetical protein [Tenuifilaceae bacterium]
MNKTALISLAIFISIALIAISVSIYIQYRRVKLFKAKGIETTATIQKLTQKRGFQRIATTDQVRRNKYYVSLTYFSQPTKEKPVSMGKVIERDSTGKYRINLGSASGIMGEYFETEIRVNSTFYNNHSVGDKVTIMYLPENPQEIMLKEDVE